MPKLTFPAPMTCEQAHGLFTALLKETLEAELGGRLEGHLLACEECSVALAEAIDRAFAPGAFPSSAVPPLPAPVTAVAGVAPAAARGHQMAPALEGLEDAAARSPALRERFGLLWEAVKQAARREKHAWAEAALAEGRHCLEGAMALWRLMFPELQGAHVGAAAAPMMGADAPGLTAEVVDETWQPQGRVVPLTIATPGGRPILTADGRFTLTVQTPETQWHGAQVVCTLVLVEARRISFASVVQPAPTGSGGEARFAATELPQGPADVPIPLEFVQLMLRPSPGPGR